MSAFTEYYSHFPDDSQYNKTLAEHLLHVATKTREIISSTGFGGDAELGYCIGLLHDIGKINPYYQELFRGERDDKLFAADMGKKYPRAHAPYSAWLAKKMLKGFSKKQIHEALVLIYKHHGRLDNTLGCFERNSPDIREHIKANLADFARHKNEPGFDHLNWDIPANFFSTAIRYDADLKGQEEHDFLRIGFLFSALLQADWGSFERQADTTFDLKVQTDSLAPSGGNLSLLRSKIQADIMSNYEEKLPIQIIMAPTGSGKTKAFLDIIKKHGTKYSRVFYFSPLLALTDDFESKIKQHDLILPAQDVLSYNSIHKETLSEEITEHSSTSWNFEYESFKKSFIITTMQRLLMIIYSPAHKDKVKLASFRDALLIIDEVQTIPKALLANLVLQLNLLNKYLNTKTILISATIPHELHCIPQIKLPQDVVSEYLRQTRKRISVISRLDVTNISEKKFLVMLNTRKSAKDTWIKLDDKNALYITSGIKKSEKQKRISAISQDNAKIVSTQTIEAGVDISLPKIYRQMAPLDSIVQMLGRLDRENIRPETALLTVFETDGNHQPYDQLEYNTSKQLLQGISDSVNLYDILPKYYKTVHEKNTANQDKNDSLFYNTKKLDFEQVWKIVKKYFGSYEDTVIIPDTKTWQETKELLEHKKYASVNSLSATLPIRSYDKKLEGYFDEDLLEKGILLPKKEKIDEIYDEYIGLDKWIEL